MTPLLQSCPNEKSHVSQKSLFVCKGFFCINNISVLYVMLVDRHLRVEGERVLRLESLYTYMNLYCIMSHERVRE